MIEHEADGVGLRCPGPRLRLELEPQEVAPGLLGLRLALPFALDHVNVWLLRDGAGWLVIDTGIADARTQARWQALREGFLLGQSIDRLLVTHFHPDHLGLAGWLCAEAGAQLLASRTEWLFGQSLTRDVSAGFVEAGRQFDRLAGLAEPTVAERAARGNLYRSRVVLPPPSYQRLQAGQTLMIDGDPWQVLIGRGHAPEMVCLYSGSRNLLIAADQILPRISPNVSVWGYEPDADPLSEFMASLAEFRRLPADCLTLPSHGQAFFGLHARIDQLREHHNQRLAECLDLCRVPATAVEVMGALFPRGLDSHQLTFALGETLAHLNCLMHQGRLAREIDAAGRWRFQRS